MTIDEAKDHLDRQAAALPKAIIVSPAVVECLIP
jgi:hypothetical protein